MLPPPNTNPFLQVAAQGWGRNSIFLESRKGTKIELKGETVTYPAEYIPQGMLLRFEIDKAKSFTDRVPSLSVSRDCWDYIDYTRDSLECSFQILVDVLLFRKVAQAHTDSTVTDFCICKIPLHDCKDRFVSILKQNIRVSIKSEALQPNSIFSENIWNW